MTTVSVSLVLFQPLKLGSVSSFPLSLAGKAKWKQEHTSKDYNLASCTLSFHQLEWFCDDTSPTCIQAKRIRKQWRVSCKRTLWICAQSKRNKPEDKVPLQDLIYLKLIHVFSANITRLHSKVQAEVLPVSTSRFCS